MRELRGYTPKSRPGPSPFYPWDLWTAPKSKGRQWAITQGKDFQCTISSMVVQIRVQAARRGASVSVYRDSPKVLVIVNHGKRKAPTQTKNRKARNRRTT